MTEQEFKALKALDEEEIAAGSPEAVVAFMTLEAERIMLLTEPDATGYSGEPCD
jgi:hypothetical protein